MPHRHSESLCPRCHELVKLQRSLNAAQPLTWFLVDHDGTLHEKTCKPKPWRVAKRKPTGPLLPFMRDHEAPARPEGQVGG